MSYEEARKQIIETTMQSTEMSEIIASSLKVMRKEQNKKPVAQIVNRYGDPEAFAEREIEISILALQSLPIGTKLYSFSTDLEAQLKENERLREENKALLDTISMGLASSIKCNCGHLEKYRAEAKKIVDVTLEGGAK